MGTDAPESRKTHITRVFGTNKAGDVLTSLSADVERMDIIRSALQVPPDLQWQGVQRKFRWCDDPYGDDYEADGTPSRDIEILKLFNAQTTEDFNDPEEWIPLKVVKASRALAETGTETNGGNAMERLVNNVTDSELNAARVVENVKVVHYDVPDWDDVIQQAADNDPSLKEYVIPADQYNKDVSSKDTNQYIEHEIITYLKHKGNTSDKIMGLGRQTKMLNQYLIDDSEPYEGAHVGSNGINPPFRLDPFQNIVNVKFITLYLIVALEGRNNSDAGGPTKIPPAVGSPTGSADIPQDQTGVTLLDSFSESGSLEGFSDYMIYGKGGDAQAIWDTDPVFNVIPLDGQIPPLPPNVAITETTAPVNYGRVADMFRRYLYKIPAKIVNTGIIEATVSGILNGSFTGTYPDRIDVNGAGQITVSVFSTVRDRKVKTFDDLNDFTPDDTCALPLSGTKQGKFKIDCKLDKDKDHVQIDNYGNKFQPYKVTIQGEDATDIIPAQPPPKIPKN